MKKTIIAGVFIFMIALPPHISNGGEPGNETIQETRLHYLLVKNDVLRYQIQKKLDEIKTLCSTLKKK